jgi:hypothetical protein
MAGRNRVTRLSKSAINTITEFLITGLHREFSNDVRLTFFPVDTETRLVGNFPTFNQSLVRLCPCTFFHSQNFEVIIIFRVSYVFRAKLYGVQEVR